MIRVPNTNTFSLQDVYNAIHDHTLATTGDLQSCFNNAISDYFNPAYNSDTFAPANSLKRFRDYTPYLFLYNEYSPISPINYVDFTGSLSTAQQAIIDFHNNGGLMRGGAFFIQTLVVGAAVESCWQSGLAIYDGYWIYGDSTPKKIIQVASGIIASITNGAY